MVGGRAKQRTVRARAALPRLIAALLLPVLAAACAEWSDLPRERVYDRLPGAVTDLVRVEDRDRTIVAAVDRDRGLFFSRDGGATWRAGRFLVPGVQALAAYGLAALPDRQIVVAGTNRGLAHTSDGGEFWSFVWEGTPGAFGLTVDPDGWPIAAAQDGLRFGDSRGVGWMPARTRLGGVSFLAVAVDPADRNRVVAGTSGAGVLLSPDRGDTWSPVYPTRATVNRIVYPAGGAVYGLAGGLILRWTDLSTDPAALPLPPEWGRPIALAAAGHSVYAGTTSGDLIALTPDPAPIDRFPAPISALTATPDEVCAGTTEGAVTCLPRPAVAG